MNPKSEALAFRIWQAAQPVGWDVTVGEMAEMLGEPFGQVVATCKRKKWLNRFRVSLNDLHTAPGRVIIGFVGHRTRLNDLADIVGRK